MEVTYWIDLSTDANGTVIKSYTGNDWLPINYFTNTDQSVEIKKLKNDLNGKANKSTTLAGYGINDAYTKSEANNKINTAVANKVTSTDVTQIKIVDKVPEVGSQTPGILYIKLLA